MALATVIAADSYEKSASYGHGNNYGHGGYGGYKTDYAVSSLYTLAIQNLFLLGTCLFLTSQHPAYYNFDWRVKDDYYYTNFGQYEARNGYDTKGNFDTVYTGYDSKPAGYMKIEYVINAHPVQVQSYGGYGHGGYSHGSTYDNKATYDNKVTYDTKATY